MNVRRRNLLTLLYLRKKYERAWSCRPKSSRTCSVRPLDRERGKFGYFRLTKRMYEMDPERFFQTYRMDAERFDDLLSRIKDDLLHNATASDPITPAERLAIALKILAHGESQQSVAISFMVGKATVNKILYEVCEAIIRRLGKEFLPQPNYETFKSTAQEFWRFWNFPMCLGAIDGKHVKIKCPINSGSQFFNYKGTYSVILMACVDAQYRFSMTDIGGYGSQGDAGTFSESKFGKAIINCTVPAPPPNKLPGTDDMVPHVFVADEAFPLRANIMRPFPGQQLNDERRIFNYRLSRARRIVENAFGILVARWRILLNAMEVIPEHADIIVQTCVILHNYLKRTDASKAPTVRYVPPKYVDYEDADGNIIRGQWRSEVGDGLTSVSQLSSNMYARSVAEIREKFVRFFLSEDGSIPNQELAALSC